MMNLIVKCSLALCLFAGLIHAVPQLPSQPSQAPGNDTSLLLCLREGTVLFVDVEDHDEESLSVRRMDTGGRVRLPWSRVDENQERSLRQRFGYLDIVSEELFVPAERIRTRDGREVVGVIVQRTENAMHIKTAQSLMVLPLMRIAGPATPTSAPALDVYTREELYRSKVLELGSQLELEDASGAAAHWDLAQFCERILDFRHAAEHYRRTAELDPDYRPQDRPAIQARAERKALAQDQVDLLADIRTQRARNNFDRALALCTAFAELYPDSPLLEDLATARSGVERARERELEKEVVKKWHYRAGRTAAVLAREPDLQKVLDYLDEGFSKDVLAAVTEDLRPILADIDEGRTLGLWSKREGGRVRRATYGIGTWLLGEDKALAGLVDEDESDKPASERESARSTLQRRIRRYLDQQRAAARASGGDTGADPDAFWATWSLPGRTQWILAHYAENSGDMRLRSVTPQTCSECAGKGVREVTFSTTGASSYGGDASGGSVTRLLACQTCQHIGIVRRISYR